LAKNCGLPQVFQNEIEDCKINKWKTLSDSDWHDELVSIERKEQRELLEEKVNIRKYANGVNTPGDQHDSIKEVKTSKKGKSGAHGGCDNPTSAIIIF
jgi:hypothetical protein